MLFLSISIIFTSALYLIFKAFDKYKVESFPVIIINYLFSTIIALVVWGNDIPAHLQANPASLYLYSSILGLAFVFIFILLNKTTAILGVSGATIVSRMSLVISATYSIVLLGDKLNILKASGIALACISIYFTVFQKKNELPQEDDFIKKEKNILIPLLAFFGTGGIDVSLKYFEQNFITENTINDFITCIYAGAFIGGLVWAFISRSELKALFKLKNILWGLLLAVCNFLSLYLFLFALIKAKIQGSVLFPVNSVGIVAVSTVLSVIIFREKINKQNAIGLALAAGAILLISLSINFS